VAQIDAYDDKGSEYSVILVSASTDVQIGYSDKNYLNSKYRYNYCYVDQRESH